MIGRPTTTAACIPGPFKSDACEAASVVPVVGGPQDGPGERSRYAREADLHLSNGRTAKLMKGKNECSRR